MIQVQARRTVAAVSVVLVLAGCTGQSSSTVPVSPSARPMATPVASPAADEFVRMPATVNNTLSSNALGCVDAPVPARYQRADLLGRPTAAVRRSEISQGHVVRVLGRDGQCFARHDDFDADRVDLYVENNRVVWARMG